MTIGRETGSRGGSTGASQSSAKRIGILDGYRALAILLVLGYHYTVRWAPPRDPLAHLPDGAMFNDVVPLTYGWIGVELFFVISGFVILMTLERCKSVTEFAVRRFARLWPPLIVAATLTTFVVTVIGPADWGVGIDHYLTSVLLVDPLISSRLLAHPHLDWVDGAYWSLGVEIQFYLFAAVIYWLARHRFLKFWLVFQGAVFALALPIAVLHYGKIDFLISKVLLSYYLPYFTLGVCLFEYYSNGSCRGWAVAGGLFSLGIMLVNSSLRLGIYNDGSPLVFVVTNCAIFALCVLFIFDHWSVGLFKTRPIVALGQASYSLYLIHQVIGVSLMRVFIAAGIPYLVVLALTVVIVISAALVLFRYVEVPAKEWVLRRSRGSIGKINDRFGWLCFGSSSRPG